jgi:hypothetical protein
MPARLIARLFDGSEHEVKVISGNPEAVLEGLTKSHRRWVEVIGGSVRYDNIVALLLVEEPAEEDRDRAITKLLRDLQARGGGSLEEVELELERRGIEIPERSRSADGDPAEVSVPITDRRRDLSSREAD